MLLPFPLVPCSHLLRYYSFLLISLAMLGNESLSAVEAPGVSFEIAPPSPWVKSIEAKAEAQNSPDAIAGGIDYVLIDQQENYASHAHYYHQVTHIMSDKGVQNGSSVDVSFDPTYQKLTLHFIRVYRPGLTDSMSQLDRSKIKLLQREPEMESFLLDGHYTAHCALEDVRPGDTIDYAFSIEGSNPVMAGRKSDTLSTEWSVPVAQASIRLVYEDTHAPKIKIRQKQFTPNITSSSGMTEWLWQETHTKPRLQDDHTPLGYDPYGCVQVSEFSDWEDVAKWASALYPTDIDSTLELNAEVLALKQISSVEKRVVTALRFVQDNVRYLSISSGLHSHKPNPPDEVLKRRFGDCKDKTRLLKLLLTLSQVEVAPVLVNSYERKSIADFLPSPYAFDHVILQVKVYGDVYWIDPTRSDQRGNLNQIYVSHFGQGLVLAPETKGLTTQTIHPNATSETIVTENYNVGDPNHPTFLDVVTISSGAAAESVRSNFKRASLDALQKSYLKFYSKRYPEISLTQPLTLTELSGGNACKVEEHYTIPHFWTLDAEKQSYTFVLRSADLETEVGYAFPTHRSDPVGWRHPVKYTNVIEAHLFKDWPLDGPPVSVISPVFRLDHTANIKGNTVTLRYGYESLADTLSVVDIPAHNTALAKLNESLAYTFTYRTKEQLSAVDKNSSVTKVGSSTKTNWFLVLCTFIIVGLNLWVCLFIYKRTEKVPPLPCPVDSAHLDGLGGWLICICLQTFLRIGTFILAIVNSWWFLDLTRWDLLTDPASPQYQANYFLLALFEWTYNWTALFFAGLLLVMFFKRRAFFRTGTIIIMLSALIIPLLDDWLTATFLNLDPVAAQGNTPGALLGMLIWIPYMIVSRRVRATFRR